MSLLFSVLRIRGSSACVGLGAGKSNHISILILVGVAHFGWARGASRESTAQIHTSKGLCQAHGKWGFGGVGRYRSDAIQAHACPTVLSSVHTASVLYEQLCERPLTQSASGSSKTCTTVMCDRGKQYDVFSLLG